MVHSRGAITLSLVLGLLVAPRAAAAWDAEVPLTSTASDVWGEGLATAGRTVHVVYGTGSVRYRRSTDDGVTWSSERTLDDGTLHLTDPLVADGADVWAIELKNLQTRSDWCCARELGDIYLLHSGDGGATWDAPRPLTTGAQAYRVSIAYASGRLHLVWMDYRRGAWDTYYLRSRTAASPGTRRARSRCRPAPSAPSGRRSRPGATAST